MYDILQAEVFCDA